MSGPHHSHPKLSFRQRLRQSLKPSTSSTNPTTTTSTGLTTTQNAVQSSANASTSNTALSLNAGNALQSSQQQQQQQQQFSFPSSISDPLVHKSWQRLSPDDRAVLQQYISPNSVDIHVAVEQALTAAADKRRICLDKRWTYTIAGRNVILREVADKVVRWLDRFKPVGDIIANVDPVHVGLPWAGVRLLLEVCMAPCNSDIPLTLVLYRLLSQNQTRWQRSWSVARLPCIWQVDSKLIPTSCFNYLLRLCEIT